MNWLKNIFKSKPNIEGYVLNREVLFEKFIDESVVFIKIFEFIKRDLKESLYISMASFIKLQMKYDIAFKNFCSEIIIYHSSDYNSIRIVILNKEKTKRYCCEIFIDEL